MLPIGIGTIGTIPKELVKGTARLGNKKVSGNHKCLPCVRVKMLDCGIVVSDFEIAIPFTFGQIPLGKVCTSLSSQP